MLRYETIGRALLDSLSPLHSPSYRVNFDGEIIIPERREKFEILTEESIYEIDATLEKKKNVFIFSLRKGLATETICKDCGNTVNCEKCMAPAVLYLSKDGKKRMFSCNRCKRRLDAETKCNNCGSWNLIPLGIGTDTVFEEVRRLFPKNKILKLDKEIAVNKKGAENIVNEFEKSTGAILVGTEMAFSYLEDKVPLSIIASFDSLWSIPNFKISEKIIQILLGMVEKTSKKIIIQTKNGNDPTITAFKDQNLLSFVRGELEDRKNLGYPPFKRFIKITHTGTQEEASRARDVLGEVLSEYEPDIFSGFIARAFGKYVTNAVIKIDRQKWSLPEISSGSSIDENLLARLQTLPPAFQVFIDPEDLL